MGCTVEYLTNTSNVISKHCICESHLCNYFHLLANDGNISSSQGKSIVKPISEINNIKILEDASKHTSNVSVHSYFVSITYIICYILFCIINY